MVIIGENGCGKCAQTKAIFSQKGIAFDYLVFSSLMQEDQNKYINLAEEQNQFGFPIIVDDDGKLTSLEVVLKTKRES